MFRACCGYFLQQWYTLADEALEDALYDSQAMHKFIGIDLGRENVPDGPTLLKFRRLLVQHDQTSAILAEVNAHLIKRGLLRRQGKVVDATTIAAPSSTKNEHGKRDPEMHQARKGNQSHFGMKMHLGVDGNSGLIHSVVCTAANAADVVHADEVAEIDLSRARGPIGFTGSCMALDVQSVPMRPKGSPCSRVTKPVGSQSPRRLRWARRPFTLSRPLV